MKTALLTVFVLGSTGPELHRCNGGGQYDIDSFTQLRYRTCISVLVVTNGDPPW